MPYHVGLDVSLKSTHICVMDQDLQVVWRGSADTHPSMIAERLKRWMGKLAGVGLETGSLTPWLYQALKEFGFQSSARMRGIAVLLDTLARVEVELAGLDKKVRQITAASKSCWHLMSVPGVGPLTSLAFMATVEVLKQDIRPKPLPRHHN